MSLEKREHFDRIKQFIIAGFIFKLDFLDTF